MSFVGDLVDSVFGSGESDAAGQGIRYIPFNTTKSQVGVNRRFSAPGMSLKKGRFTLSDSFANSDRRSLNNFRSSLNRELGALRGNQNAFIQARVNPLRENIALSRGELTSNLGRRGVMGSIGDRQLEGFDYRANRELGDQMALATQEAINTRLPIYEAIRSATNETTANRFTRSLQGLQLSANTMQQLLAIASNLSTGTGSNAVAASELNDKAGQSRREGIGNAVGALAAPYLLPFSDRRLKENVRKIGELDTGISVYRYNYIWDKEPQVGVMADEVSEKHPDAVKIHKNGFMMVDYSKVPGWSDKWAY